MAFKAQGCCDLNIKANSAKLKEVVLEALSLGFQTIAINTVITDQPEKEEISNKKRGDGKNSDGPVVPPPTRLTLTVAELERRGIRSHPPPVILTRLTVIYYNPSKPFLHKAKGTIELYDLVAFTPMTEEALKQVTQTIMYVDIISLDLSSRAPRLLRKLLRAAVQRDIYFEINYCPMIGSGNPSLRQSTIQLGYKLADCIHSRHIIVSSGASSVAPLRSPHDVANLSRLFGLSPGAAHSAVKLMCHDAVYCAAQRRLGANKCNVAISFSKELMDHISVDNGQGEVKRKTPEDDKYKVGRALKKQKQTNPS